MKFGVVNLRLSNLTVVFLMMFSLGTVAQDNDTDLTSEIKTFQTDLDEDYQDKKTSPLTTKERKSFQGHGFYPIDLSYVVEAKFERIVEEDTVELMSSSGNIKLYRPFAKVYFRIGDTQCVLTAFQSFRMRDTEEYKNYLLLPFRDATSGNTSYGGGRYLDILIPAGNTIELNFNLAYNPYCAYTAGYNCTVPPKENTLKAAIKSGVKAPLDH